MERLEITKVSGSPVSGGLPEQGFLEFDAEEQEELETLNKWIREVFFEDGKEDKITANTD